MADGDRPFGWGVVGFGWVARDYAVPGLLASGGRLAAVFDPDAEAQRLAGEMGATAHPTLDALLRDPAVEAIYVATPNHLHRAAVEAAAAAGVPVLCEKPMAATLTDAEAMAAAVERAGVLYGTAFDQRHHPAHVALREAIRGGLIGTVTAVRIAYCCWLGREWTSLPGHGNWRADAAQAGGGALMDLAPHGLDLTQFLLEEPVVEVVAMTQRRVQDYAVDDGAVILGRTASGVLLQQHNSYNCPDALPRRRLEVLGSRGQVVAENTMGQTAGGTLTHTDAAGVVAALPFGDQDVSPFARQMAAFAAAARGAPHDFSGARDIATMRLLHQAYASDPRCR
ncbi:Gfo/Idh/MocA family protein [Roseomonas elaeocarpi]|uniref:Gfo/Idh/MocA family protein n=1 Tax=Roseomonas elaeocarpi TaxID=907779 RepID=A0ABV6JVM1_9PROT